jgi:hypothetical protein
LQQTLNGSPSNQGWAGVGNVSVHWDGDDVLLAVGNGTGIDVEIGKLGATNESASWGITVTDRDMTGSQVAAHTATAFSAWSSAPPTKPYHVLCNGCKNELGYVSGAISSGDAEYAPATQYLSTGRTDGYDDGYGNTFQGVRAYDENTSQWTAPDAYAGDVHDPMSQKPFMWNRNNPLEYEDPSGYQPYGNGGEPSAETMLATWEAWGERMRDLDKRAEQTSRSATAAPRSDRAAITRYSSRGRFLGAESLCSAVVDPPPRSAASSMRWAILLAAIVAAHRPLAPPPETGFLIINPYRH